MKTRIELDPGMARLPSPDKTPRVALGTDIRLAAGIGNAGSTDLVIEDPKTTQLLMVHVKSPQDTGETSFLLNPSNVDALGETTAPPRSEVTINPGSYAPFRISLYKHMLDKCLSHFAKPDLRAFTTWWEAEKERPDLEARFRALR